MSSLLVSSLLSGSGVIWDDPSQEASSTTQILNKMKFRPNSGKGDCSKDRIQETWGYTQK